MSFPRYPEYKNSGVNWLGDIPTHWELVRAKTVFKEIDERSSNGDEELLTVSHLTGVTPRSEKNVTMTMAESLEGYKKCAPGDLVINTMWAWMGALGIANGHGIVSPSYNVYRPNTARVLPVFFDQLCRIPAFATVMKALSSGIWESRLRLYPEAFFSIPLALPPLEEQAAIAAFLDDEIGKIDALIVEQEALIRLLKEKRHAIIGQTVSKGLNPSAPMKDSGCESLGQVPEHWAVKQLKHLVDPSTSITYGIVQAGPEVEGGIPYIKTSDMSGESLPVDGYSLTSPEIDRAYERSKLAKGDLVIAIRATVGKCLPVPDELEGANLTQGTARISPNAQVANKQFLLAAINSHPVQGYFDRVAKGATFKEITLDALRRTPIAIPPLDEQMAIAALIEAQTVKFDTLTADALRAIDLLKEHRTALISAAVTGKIDVRQPSAKVVPFPPRQRRNLVAAEVIRRCHNDNTFGRTKAQKLFYLLDAHLGIQEFDGQYLRWIAGPYDSGMMASVASDLEHLGWFSEVEKDGRYHYRPLTNAAEVRGAFERAWGQRQDEIGRLIDLLRPLDTQESEVVATLYAAWNDFLLCGEAVDDAKLIREVRTNWHESKLAIPERAWNEGLRWMRKHGVVPKGTGRPTIQQMSLGL